MMRDRLARAGRTGCHGSAGVRGWPAAVTAAGACARGARQNDEVESSRSRPRDVVLLGSTGSVGTQAADVIRRNPGRFRVTGLAAGGSNPGLLAEQAIEFGAAVVAVERESAAAEVREALKAHAAEASRAGRTGQVPGPLTGQRLAPPSPHGPPAPHGPSPALGGVTGPGGPAQPVGGPVSGYGPLSGYGPVSGGFGSWPAAPETRPNADGGVPLPTVLAGPDAVAEVAAWPADVVLNAVTGFSGLAATLAALRAGRVCLQGFPHLGGCRLAFHGDHGGPELDGLRRQQARVAPPGREPGDPEPARVPPDHIGRLGSHRAGRAEQHYVPWPRARGFHLVILPCPARSFCLARCAHARRPSQPQAAPPAG